jgi:HK97 family phage prohead protease
MQQLDPTREEYDSFLIPAATSAADAPNADTEDDDSPVQVIETEGKRQLVGYAVVWGAVSSPRRDGFRHRFARGSVSWTTPTLALWHHDPATPLASTSNATLAVTEDDHGAKVTITLDETTDGSNAFTRVKNRLVAGMSFGGRRLAYDRSDNPKVIDVTSFVADEVSVTIIPAMTETNIVTADQTDELAKSAQAMKESQMKSQHNQLSKIRLAMLKP